MAPARFAADTFAPARISRSAVSRSSACAAQWSAVVPSICGALTFAFFWISVRTAALSPCIGIRHFANGAVEERLAGE